MALEITRALQGDEVVSKTDAESSYAKLTVDNTYAQGIRNIFRTLPEVYTQSTLPTKPVDFTTKKYVDDNFLQVSTQSNIGKQVDQRLNVNGLLSMRGGNDIEMVDSSGNYKSIHKNGNNLQWGGQNLATEEYVNNKVANVRPRQIYAFKGEIRTYASKAEFDAIVSRLEGSWTAITGNYALVTSDSNVGTASASLLQYTQMPPAGWSMEVKALDLKQSTGERLVYSSSASGGGTINSTGWVHYTGSSMSAPENWNDTSSNYWLQNVRWGYGPASSTSQQTLSTSNLPRLYVYTVKFTADTYFK